MRKADYKRIAESYDQARPITEQNLKLWLDLISRLGNLRRNSTVLDLGCGTGRFAIPIATQLGCKVVGVDASTSMLAKAKEKAGADQVAWVLASAEALPCQHESFDAVFMSHLLHHVNEPVAVLKECYRVLRVGGALLIRYGAIEQIRADVVHRFFPEALPIDEARTSSVARVEGWLKEVGFKRVHSQEIVQQTFPSTQALLEAIRLKSTSVLTLISEEAFQKGLKRLELYIHEHPDEQFLLEDKLTLSVGYK